MIGKPEAGVLALLDVIFDYLTIHDLEKMVLVCKFFCFVATLDKLFDKFEIQHNSKVEQHLFDKYDNNKGISESL